MEESNIDLFTMNGVRSLMGMDLDGDGMGDGMNDGTGDGMGDMGGMTMDMSMTSDKFCISTMSHMASHGSHSSSSTAGMIMYMDGFRFTLKGGQPCLNLYFPGWTLDSKGKVVGAMFGVLFMAILVEGISKLRHIVVRAARKASMSPEQDSWNSHFLRLSITLMHGSQAFLGYILMLATMTFSVELLLAVVVGLAIGYAVFFQTEEAFNEKHVTSNPCCNFMEEEAKEIKSAAFTDSSHENNSNPEASDARQDSNFPPQETA